jgi:hypothetical protein
MYCRQVIDTVNPELAATLLVLLSAIYMPFKVLVMYMLDLNICRTVLLALVTFLFNIACFC